MDKLYSAREVADIIHCAESTISLYRKSKLIRGKRIGNRYYYTEADVEVMRDAYENNQEDKGSICWLCANTYSGCIWSDKYEPVPGWDAIKVDNNYLYRDFSYVVKKCPKFVNEKELRK